MPFPLIFAIPAALAAIAATENNHPRTKIQSAIDDVKNKRISPQEAHQKINEANEEFMNLIANSQSDHYFTGHRTQQKEVTPRERIINLYNSGQLTKEQMEWFKNNNHKLK